MNRRRQRPGQARRVALVVQVAVALTLLWADVATADPTRIASIGAWCWFSDPRAIEYDGSVVFGWVADDGSIMVGNTRGERFNLAPRLERDDHNNPAFYIRRDGRLMAFWNAHSGKAIYYRTATRGITEWGAVRTGPANPPSDLDQYTYPNPRRVGGTLYLFWSGPDGTAAFATSNNDGDTWSQARRLFSGEYARYVKYAQDGDEIHVAWNIGHPTQPGNTYHSGIYHAVIRDGKIWRQDGTQIGDLHTPLPSDAGDRIYDIAINGPAWIHDIEVSGGVPHIAYATFPTFANHTYRVATWARGRWVDEHLTYAGPSFESAGSQPAYSGGINLDPDDPTIAYLSRQVEGEFEIERWTRAAGGWVAAPVTSRSLERNVRPFPVAGGVAWMRGPYPRYWQFRTELLWQPAPRRQDPQPPDDPAPDQPDPEPPVVEQPRQTPVPSKSEARRPAKAKPKARTCGQPLARWRSTRNPAALRRYWACRARQGQCRATLRQWRARRSGAALRAYRVHCRAYGVKRKHGRP